MLSTLLLPLVSALPGYLYMRYPNSWWITPGDTLPIAGIYQLSMSTVYKA